MRRRLLICLLSVVLVLGFFVSNVSARGGVYVIEPNQEVIDSAELTLSGTVYGNVTVSDGFIDFYVTSPSDKVLLRYNKTAFTSFESPITENGIYRFHLVNTWSTNNVTATLEYRVNFEVVLQQTITLTSSVSTTVSSSTTVYAPSPNLIDWMEVLRLLGVAFLPFARVIVEWIFKILNWLWWRRKHGKSRTPVVISPIAMSQNSVKE